jgi:hypothetical protein
MKKTTKPVKKITLSTELEQQLLRTHVRGGLKLDRTFEPISAIGYGGKLG